MYYNTIRDDLLGKRLSRDCSKIGSDFAGGCLTHDHKVMLDSNQFGDLSILMRTIDKLMNIRSIFDMLHTNMRI